MINQFTILEWNPQPATPLSTRMHSMSTSRLPTGTFLTPNVFQLHPIPLSNLIIIVNNDMSHGKKVTPNKNACFFTFRLYSNRVYETLTTSKGREWFSPEKQKSRKGRKRVVG